MKKLLSALIIATAMTITVGHALAAEKSVSVVLVHGAFVDGSGWQQVYSRLKKGGYEVIVVQNSTATLEGDVATTDQAIGRAKYPVVLVGHSYGGIVITEAGVNPKVRNLAYIAAFAPDEGESVSSLISKPVPGAAKVPILPPQDGFLTLDVAKFPASFAADVDLETTTFMASSQVPWGVAAVDAKITNAAWKTKPTFFLITTNDHMIPTPSQREMATRARASMIEVASSHAVMLSHPDKVASFIERVADSTK